MNKKDVATAFLEQASTGDVRDAYEKYVHPGFFHHNVYFEGDRETLLRGMEDNAREFPEKEYEVLRVLEDGELVAIHGKVALSPEIVFSVIHIFRFEDDKIIESWEASQEELKDSPNRHGLF